MRGTLPRRKRYGAPEHAATLATATANQIVAEQPQRPHPPSAGFCMGPRGNGARAVLSRTLGLTTPTVVPLLFSWKSRR